jgi:hypothetical protein
MHRACSLVPTILVLAAAMTALGASASAQRAAPENARPQNPTPRNAPLIDLDFPGGTVNDYISAICKVGDAVNIALAPEAGELAVPPVRLTRVSIDSALSLLDGRRGTHTGAMIELETDRFGPDDAGGSPVYIVRGKLLSRQAAPEPAGTSSAWAVSDILASGVKPEDLLTAIEAALAMIGGSAEPAQLRFHAATGLMIARGNGEQITTIAQIISASRSAAEQRQQEPVRQLHAARAEIMKLRTALSAVNVRLPVDQTPETPPADNGGSP